MTDLNLIQSEPTATRRLTNISFNKGSELTFTDASQGGACSLKNESYLMKANAEKAVELTDNQARILSLIKEDYNPLTKSGNPDSSPSVSDKVAEDEILKHKEDEMSKEAIEAIQKEMAGVQKALRVSEAVNAVSGYALESDVQKGLATAMADLDETGVAAVTKALDEVVARVEKAQNAKKVEDEKLEKAAAEDKAPTELEKKLDAEAGHEEKTEVIAKSLVDQLNELAQGEAK